MESGHQLAGDPLSGLAEIPLPMPVSYWPQTMGWVIVCGVVLLALGYASWRIIRHRQATAYRRQALSELAEFERQLRSGRQPLAWGALPTLLKRTAMAATTRQQVAALSGEEWLRFLDRSLGGTQFQHGPGRLLARIAYATSLPAGITRDQIDSLITLSRRWIRHHHADV